MRMNIAKIQAMLEHVPDNALVGYVQNPDGQVPSYLALAEISRRKELRNNATPQQQSAPTQTVAQQELAAVEPGVAGLPVPDDMYQEKSMATGGIVSFADGGDVSQADIDYAAWQRGDVITPALGRIAFPAYYGLEGIGEWIGGKRWVRDPVTGKLVRADTIKKPAPVEKPNPNTKEGADAIRQERTADFLSKQAQQQLSDPAYIAQVNKNKIMADMAAGKYDQVPPGAGTPPGPNAPPRPDMPATPATSAGLPAITAPKIQYDEAGYDQAMLPKRDAAAEAARFKSMLGEDKGIAALQDRLAKMEAKASAEGEQAPWMALAKAGFGMAAGKSPFALQNIAEGAGVGLKEYADAKARLAAGEEKRFEIQAKIAQTQRAEDMAAAKFGTESEQYADTQNRLAKLHALDAKNTAKVHDAANELTAQKNAIDAQQAAWNHQYQMGSLQNQAAQAGKLSDFETHIAGLKQDPSYYKTIETPQGPKRIFDMAKATAEYRGTDTKQAALLAPLYDKLEKTFDKGQQAAILAQIRRIEAGLYGGDVTAAPTGPRQKPLSAF